MAYMADFHDFFWPNLPRVLVEASIFADTAHRYHNVEEIARFVVESRVAGLRTHSYKRRVYLSGRVPWMRNVCCVVGTVCMF
jgi:hypothetical protein